MAPPPAFSHLRRLLPLRLFCTAAPTQESVLDSLTRLSEDPSLALAFFRSSQSAGHPLGSAAYNIMLRTLACHPPSAQSHFWPFLHEMNDASHYVDKRTYTAALSSFKKARLTADYASLVAHYTKAQAPISAAADAVRGLEGSEASAELDKKLEGVDLLLSENAVAKVLWEVRDYPLKALDFFRWAGRQKGYKHGSVAYNAMAWVLAREESVREFWELIQEMKADGMRIDIDTYVQLSRQFQKRHMLTEVVELYELMMDGPYDPLRQDGPLILGLIASEPSLDLELAYRVVRKFEAVWEFKTKDVFDGIHRVLTSNGSFDEAAVIVERMKGEGHQPDNITYSQLVFGLCKANKFDEARKVLDEMEAEGCIPNLKTWTMLIQGHCVAGEVDKALQYLTEMIDKDLEADAYLLHVMVEGMCSHNKVDAAHALFVEMVDKANLRPWQGTYRYIMGELLRVKKLEDALGLLGSMKAHKFQPFADPFPTHIAKYGTLEDARQFLRASAMKKSVSHRSYIHVFKSFFTEGRYSEAQDLLNKCPTYVSNHRRVTELFKSVKVENAS
ncbi:hypothetical protein ABZP36_017378 [Zizania latifolia]